MTNSGQENTTHITNDLAIRTDHTEIFVDF